MTTDTGHYCIQYRNLQYKNLQVWLKMRSCFRPNTTMTWHTCTSRVQTHLHTYPTSFLESSHIVTILRSARKVQKAICIMTHYTSNVTSVTEVRSTSTHLFAGTWRPLGSDITTLSSSSVVSRAFSVLCVFSKSGHHPHPIGYLCAKFRFFCDLHCWASPWRKIAYTINHLPSLFVCSGNWSTCALEKILFPKVTTTWQNRNVHIIIIIVIILIITNIIIIIMLQISYHSRLFTKH